MTTHFMSTPKTEVAHKNVNKYIGQGHKIGYIVRSSLLERVGDNQITEMASDETLESVKAKHPNTVITFFRLYLYEKGILSIGWGAHSSTPSSLFKNYQTV